MNEVKPKRKRLMTAGTYTKRVHVNLLEKRRSFDQNDTRSQGISSQMEPYTSPGDYDVPKLIGNKSIVISSIKTPPQFTFTKQGRNLGP